MKNKIALSLLNMLENNIKLFISCLHTKNRQQLKTALSSLSVLSLYEVPSNLYSITFSFSQNFELGPKVCILDNTNVAFLSDISQLDFRSIQMAQLTHLYN